MLTLENQESPEAMRTQGETHKMIPRHSLELLLVLQISDRSGIPGPPDGGRRGAGMVHFLDARPFLRYKEFIATKGFSRDQTQ